MDQDLKNKFVKRIAYVVYNTSDYSNVDLPIIFESSSPARLAEFVLFGNPAIKYREIIEDILKCENWGSKFSEKYIDKKLWQLIVEAREEKNKRLIKQKVSACFDKLVDEFENYSTEYVAYVPLTGIEMQDVGLINDGFPIGNVVLLKMTEARLNTLGATKPNVSAVFLDRLKERICVRLNVVAEEERALERTDEEAKRIVDLLRYSVPSIYPKSLYVASGIGVLGEALVGTPQVAAIVPVSGGRPKFPGRSRGPLSKFELTSENTEIMKQIGIFSIAELLKESNLTDFKESLLRGIHWISDSLVQFEKENELLSLIACLESVIPNNREAIKTRIAKGVAAIVTPLLADQKNLGRKRGELKRFIIKMYNKRSAITHGGHVEILEGELGRLQYIIRLLVTWLIKQAQIHTFHNQESLSMWIESHS